MKNKSLIVSLIILLAIICISLICFMVGVINKNIKITRIFTSYKQSNKLVINEIYDNNFDVINIDMDSGDVYVKESNDDRIKVLVYGEEKNSLVNAKEDRLTVKAKEKKCFGFCFNATIAKIEIYLPSDYKNAININNNYGDVKIDKFLKANIKVEESCGDVLIKGALTAKVSNDYGDITINSARDINVDASAGDIKIGTVNNITVKNNYGDIEINNVLNYMNIEADCGDIEIENVNINKSSTITNDYGDVLVGSTKEIYIDAETDFGDIDIKNNYRKSDIILKIKNDCGDIEVNN